jgi:hypothetical protein
VLLTDTDRADLVLSVHHLALVTSLYDVSEERRQPAIGPQAQESGWQLRSHVSGICSVLVTCLPDVRRVCPEQVTQDGED